ncbi:MAG: hypothetical protein CMJ64_16340 [Planctomycetaceae bacterium]|nr:hypothetical protein [Planctomycetaceae bacterium]
MRPYISSARHPARSRGACLFYVLLLITTSVVAQNSLPPGYRAYPLRHRDAETVAPQLRTMLSGVADDTRVLVDSDSNRLVVQGPAQAQELANQFVSAIDRPLAEPATEPKPASTFRAYGTNGADPVAVAAKLQEQFRAARIEADPRTGRVLVVAPEGTHRQIAAVFQADQPEPARSSAGHILRNVSWRAFEDQLRRLWGSQVTFPTARNGKVATVTLATARGPQAIMQIDRRANMLTFNGDAGVARVWRNLAQALDKPLAADQSSYLVSLRNADPAKVQRAVALVQRTSIDADSQVTATIPLNRQRFNQDTRTALLQQDAAAAGNQPAPAAPPGQAPPANGVPTGEQDPDASGTGLIGSVQIEFLEGLDAIIIRGRPQDVARVRQIIEEIERLSDVTQPVVEVYPLMHVNSEALVTLVLELYEEILAPRQGPVSIRALVEPNSVLLIGREESVQVVTNLLRKLDQPTQPSDKFEIFRLKFVSAVDAETAIRNFFVNQPGTDTELRPGLGTRVQVSSDYRTNTLIVQASPRDMAEVRRLVESLDVDETPTSAQVKIFKLKNSIAEELAEVLQNAISAESTTQGQQQQPGQGGAAATQGTSRLPSITLEMILIDEEGGRLLRSGILADVQVNADPNTNSLVVRAPAKSMELIGALIEQLDQMPDAEAQLKVFTIMNGDATSLAATLQQVFGQDVTIGQGTGGAFGIAFRQPQVQTTTAGGENSLVPLTFAVDIRTNSVIASGSSSDLEVVETLLLRLDEEGFTTNEIVVYRLKNNSSDFVAQAIQDYVTSQRNTLNQTVQAGLSTTLDTLLLQVTAISEPISNSVIVAASPRYMETIMQVVRDLDVRPPMVLVQCLIAEVFLGDVHEFGAELGVQDDLLFDRGIASLGGDASIPGFNFSRVTNGVGTSPGLPNLNDVGRSTVGTQGISDLGLGRTMSLLGSGSPGLVLSAASDSVNILVRALEEQGRLQVLSRPQVMALNNQPAFVQVGRDIARFNGSTATNTGVTQDVTDVPTGLILAIEPRINDDGVVVMTVDADKSEQGSAADGTVLSDGAGGTFIVPPINRTTAQTTISAKNGQTVVIGGLITKRDEVRSTGVPWLRDIPVAGHLFNFEAKETIRTELLLILTPYIVSEDEDYEIVKMMESQRMNWCLGDVVSLDGERGLEGAGCMFCSDDVPVLFPDDDPTGSQFAAGEHQHAHEAPQPSPIALPNEQTQHLQRSGIGQPTNLQQLPQQAINAGYRQLDQPVYQANPRYDARPAAYVPNQQQNPAPTTNQQPRATFKPSWFPFRRQ